ncbi:MAG: tetratricopeptide repeat protein, partial [candidate division WOR-3 bacterium]
MNQYARRVIWQVVLIVLFGFEAGFAITDFFQHHNEIQKAKIISQVILSENPLLVFDYQPAMQLGIYYYYLHDFSNAEKYFRRALIYAQESTEVFESYYWLGKNYLQQSKYNEALKALLNIQQSSAKISNDYLYVLGISLYYNSQYEAALNCLLNYEMQLGLRSRPKQLSLFIAAAALGKDDYNLSQEYLTNKIVNKGDFYPLVDYMAGFNLFLTKNYKQSMAYLKNICTDSVNRDITNKARVILAAIYQANNEITKAINEYQTIINSSDPNFIDYAYINLGIAYYRLKKYQNALVVFDTLLQKEPKTQFSDLALFYRAKIFERTSRITKAQSEYRKFIALYPNSELTENAKYALLNLWWHSENFMEANTLGEDFLKRYPNNRYREVVLYNLVKGHYVLKNYQKLKKYAQEFIREFANSKYIFDVYYWLGMSSIENNEYQLAFKYLPLVKNSKWRPFALKEIADLYLNLDSLEQALFYYEQALTISSDSLRDEIYYQQEIVFLQQGKYENKLAMMRGYLEKYPLSQKAAQVQFTIADYFKNNEEYNQAIVEFDNVYKYQPNLELFAATELAKGECYRKINDLENAKNSYLKIVNLSYEAKALVPAMFALAVIYDTLMQYDSAILFYNKLLSQTLTKEEAEFVL